MSENADRLDRSMVIDLALEEIDRAIESANAGFKSAEDGMLNAQTRNESRYDTYREEFSRVAENFAARMKSLEQSKSLVEGLREHEGSEKVKLGSIVEAVRDDGEKVTFVVVETHSMKVELNDRDITFVSLGTPIARSLVDRTPGESVEVHAKRSFTLDLKAVY